LALRRGAERVGATNGVAADVGGGRLVLLPPEGAVSASGSGGCGQRPARKGRRETEHTTGRPDDGSEGLGVDAGRAAGPGC